MNERQYGFCEFCGTPVLDPNTKFCMKCGKPVTITEQFNQSSTRSSQNNYTTAQTPQEVPSFFVPSNFSNQNSGAGYSWDAPALKSGANYHADEATINKFHSSAVYKDLSKKSEYNPTWLNVKTQQLEIPQDDIPVLSFWTKQPFRLKSKMSNKIKNFFSTAFWFGLYAIIAFFINQGNYPRSGADAAVQALFFPFIIYMFGAYTSVDRYIKSILSSLFMFLLVVQLFNWGIISWKGVPFFFPILLIAKINPAIAHQMQQAMVTNGAQKMILDFLMIIFILELILLIFHWVIKKDKKFEYVLSNKRLFIRDKSKKSGWEMFKLVMYIFFNPFNVKYYKDMTDRIKFNKMTSKEGHYFDFAMIPLTAIYKIKKKKQSTALIVIVGIIMGFSILSSLIPVFLFVLILFIKLIRTKGKYKIVISFKREESEGSWIKTHKENIITMVRVDEKFAEFFATYNNKK